MYSLLIIILFSFLLLHFFKSKNKAALKNEIFDNIIYRKYIQRNINVRERQLIITVGYGYNKYKLSVFYNSLMKTNYRGKKLLFIHEKVDSETVAFLNKNKVKMVLLSNNWPYFSSSNKEFIISPNIINTTIPKHNIERHFKIAVLRYFLVLAFLIQFKNRYDRVLVIDVRDVYFQLNPFSWNIQKGISVFEESRAKKIYNQYINNKWIKSLNYSYDSIKFNYIINGGAIVFTPSEGINFLRKYYEIFEIVKNRGPNDQSIFNVMIYGRFYKGIVNIYQQTNTPIRNLVLERLYLKFKPNSTNALENMKWKNNILYNEDGTIPVVLHQYDRIKDLKELISQILFLKDF